MISTVVSREFSANHSTSLNHTYLGLFVIRPILLEQIRSKSNLNQAGKRYMVACSTRFFVLPDSESLAIYSAGGGAGGGGTPIKMVGDAGHLAQRYNSGILVLLRVFRAKRIYF